MKLSTTLLLVAALAVVAFQADAKGIYRGVGTNAWSGGCADINALSRMSWYYNWGLQPTSNVASCNLGSRYLEFVPMVWGAGSVPNLVSKVRPLSELNELTCPGPSANHR
jgi:hypothetical protein